MKNFNFLAALFISGLVLSTTSCGDDTEETVTPPPAPPAKISLSVAGGEAVAVDGADVTKFVTITASEKSDKDISVTLKSDAAAGQVAFPVNPVTIKAGTTSVKASVTFTLEGFPAGTEEKPVGITISSSTSNVTIGTATTTFTVKGKGGAELIDLAVTTNGTEFNTTNAAQEAKITFTLAKPLDTDLSVVLAYANDSELKDVVLPEVKITKGQTTTTSTITVAQGAVGVMKLTLATEKAKLDKEALTFTFKKDAVPVASISTEGNLTNITVPSTGNITKTITITLDKNATKEVIANLSVTGNATLSASSVTIASGKNSGTATITFSAEKYATDVEKTVTVTMTAANSDLTVGNNNNIQYKVKGTAVIADPEASISTEGNMTSITVPSTNVSKTITVTLTKEATKATAINLTLSGDANGSTLNANSVTIAQGQRTGTATITFSKDVFTSNIVSKVVTITATSSDVKVTDAQKSITYTVTGPQPAGNKQDLELFFNTNNSLNESQTSIDITNDSWIYIRKGVDKTQNGDITLKYEIKGFESSELWLTGGGVVGGTDAARNLTGSVVVKPTDNGIFNINLGGCPTSKKGSVTFTSDDATFAGGASSSIMTINFTKP